MRADQKHLAELFATMEMKLSELYKVCAFYFTRNYELWTNLSLDEADHADQAKTFATAALAGKLKFVDSKARVYLINAALQHVDDMHKAVTSGRLDGKHALKMALDLEESIIEKEIFSHFIGPDEKVQHTLDKLKAETIFHSKVLQKVITREQEEVEDLTSAWWL